MAAHCWPVTSHSLCSCDGYFIRSRDHRKPTSSQISSHNSIRLPFFSSVPSFPTCFLSFPAASSRLQRLRGHEEAQTRHLRPLAKAGEEQELNAVREDSGSGADAGFAAENAENHEGKGVKGLVRAPSSSVVAGSTVEEANTAVGFYEGRKTVQVKKKKGAVIADFLTVFGGLLDRPFGSGQSMAAAGAVVIEKVVSDAKVLREEEGVNEQAIYELLRVLRLLEMDLELINAAVKPETLLERLVAAKRHSMQAVLIANAI